MALQNRKFLEKFCSNVGSNSIYTSLTSLCFQEGLHNQLNAVNDYCSDWKLTLNAENNSSYKTVATLKKNIRFTMVENS